MQSPTIDHAGQLKYGDFPFFIKVQNLILLLLRLLSRLLPWLMR